MSDIFQSTRAGTRGGQDQFKWDDVKLDKDRDHYLGHSLQVRTRLVQKPAIRTNCCHALQNPRINLS